MVIVARAHLGMVFIVCVGSACGRSSEGQSENESNSKAHGQAMAPTDAAVPQDAALWEPPVVDDAGPPEACGQSEVGNGWGELPKSCLPRCTAQTGVAYRKCTTEECMLAAIAEDATPGARVETYAGIRTVSCSGSVNTLSCKKWQTYSCLADACPDAYYELLSCTQDCEDEQAAMTECAEAHPAFAPCLNERISACFERESSS